MRLPILRHDIRNAVRGIVAHIVGVETERPAPGVVLVNDLDVGKREIRREVSAELVQRLEDFVRVRRFAELRNRRVELVAERRQVVVVGVSRRLPLVEEHPFLRTVRIRPARVHVVAEHVRAASELHKRHRVRIHRRDTHAMRIRRRHSAAEFAREVRILRRRLVVAVRLRELFGGDIGGDARIGELERLCEIAGAYLRPPLPESVRIVAEERQYLAVLDRAAHLRPARASVERHVEAAINRKLLKRLHIRPGPAALVLKLNADDAPAVLPEMPLRLFAKALPELFDTAKELPVGRAQLLGCHPNARNHPVRQTALDAFTVAPRSDAKHYGHALLLADLQKRTDVAPPGEVELAFFLFVMHPERISRENIHSAILHLADVVAPFPFRDAGVVHFAHDRHLRLAVEADALGRHDYLFALGIHPRPLRPRNLRFDAWWLRCGHAQQLLDHAGIHPKCRAVPDSAWKLKFARPVFPRCAAVVADADAVASFGIDIVVHKDVASDDERSRAFHPVPAEVDLLGDLHRESIGKMFREGGADVLFGRIRVFVFNDHHPALAVRRLRYRRIDGAEPRVEPQFRFRELLEVLRRRQIYAVVPSLLLGGFGDERMTSGNRRRPVDVELARFVVIGDLRRPAVLRLRLVRHDGNRTLLRPVRQVLRRRIADYLVVPRTRPHQMESAVRSLANRRIAHKLVLAHLWTQHRIVPIQRFPLQPVVAAGEVQSVALPLEIREQVFVLGEARRRRDRRQRGEKASSHGRLLLVHTIV